MSHEKEDGQGIRSTEDLTSLLKKYKIPINQWGSEGNGRATKTIQDLFREISNGETILKVNGSELYRSVSLVHIDIYYEDDKGQRWQLIEEKQTFASGQERRRSLTGVNEKMRPGESAIDAAERGLSEEVELNNVQEFLQLEKTTETQLCSPSYPGLDSRYTTHHFTLMLTAQQAASIQMEEYEVADGKTTFFAWKRCDQ